MKLLFRIVRIASILFFIFGLLIYFGTTKSTTITDNPISISKATYNNDSQSIEIVPTSTAKPDVTYSIIMDNSIFKQSFTISWNQLELTIRKSKTLTNHLSPDQVTAIQMHPSYSTTIFQIDHTHPIIWVIIPPLVLVLAFIVPYFLRTSYMSTDNKSLFDFSQLSSADNVKALDLDKTSEYIQNALEIMDDTAKRYNGEEEANRALVALLKQRGIETHYQYRLPNGRAVDIKAGNVLIEGKLSPDTAEVDRLIGQLSEYTKYSDKVYVVIYGQLNEYARSRIQNEIEQRYFNKVFLKYLPNPNRQ